MQRGRSDNGDFIDYGAYLGNQNEHGRNTNNKSDDSNSNKSNKNGDNDGGIFDIYGESPPSASIINNINSSTLPSSPNSEGSEDLHLDDDQDVGMLNQDAVRELEKMLASANGDSMIVDATQRLQESSTSSENDFNMYSYHNIDRNLTDKIESSKADNDNRASKNSHFETNNSNNNSNNIDGNDLILESSIYSFSNISSSIEHNNNNNNSSSSSSSINNNNNNSNDDDNNNNNGDNSHTEKDIGSVPITNLLSFDDSPQNTPLPSSNECNQDNSSATYRNVINDLDPSWNWKEREFVESWEKSNEDIKLRESRMAANIHSIDPSTFDVSGRDDENEYNWRVYEEISRGGSKVLLKEPYLVPFTTNNSYSNNKSNSDHKYNDNSNNDREYNSRDVFNGRNINSISSIDSNSSGRSPLVATPLVVVANSNSRRVHIQDDENFKYNNSSSHNNVTNNNNELSDSDSENEINDISSSSKNSIMSLTTRKRIEDWGNGNNSTNRGTSLYNSNTTVISTSESSSSILTAMSVSAANSASKVATRVSELVSVDNMMNAVSLVGTAVSSSTSNALGSLQTIGGQVGPILAKNPWVSKASGAVSETCHHTSDRLQQLADYYGMVLTGDDPETQYLTKFKDGGREWDVLLRSTASLATLDWKRRQLIKETRDNSYADDFKKADVRGLYLDNRLVSSGSSASNNTAVKLSDVDIERIKDNILKNIPCEVTVDVLKLLIDDANQGDENSQYALTKYFTPPKFEEKTECFKCNRQFGISLFRHHCRNCGKSFCSNHSMNRRKLLHRGMVTPVRVCNSCADSVDRQENGDMLLWKQFRIEAFFRTRDCIYDISGNPISNGELIPYTCPMIDRGIDKAHRVVDYTLQFLKSNLILNYPAKIAVETVNILKLYGMSGLAGVLLRRDFVEAVETLKHITKIENHFSLSLHELTAVIYYKIAINRGIRGCIPEEEARLHLPSNNAENTSYRCRRTRDDELNEAIRIAPLALKSVYEEDEVENQRIARSQGWSLVYCESKSLPEKPAYSMYACHINNRHLIDDNSEQYRGEVVLAVRGTSTIQDVVTDIRSQPILFPPSKDSIDRLLNGEIYKAENFDDVKLTSERGQKDKEDSGGCTDDTYDWLWIEGNNYACGGMARAAMWLLSQVGPSLRRFHEMGYRITLTGHSLGGAVSTLLAYMIKSRFPSTFVVAYSCPAMVDENIAEEMRSYVLTVILRDDVIPRFTPKAIRLLMSDLSKFKLKYKEHMQLDYNDAIERAGSLWSPRWRAIHNAHQVKSNKANFSLNDLIDGGNMLSSSNDDGDFDEIKDIKRDFFVPGVIIHIYSYRGKYRSAVIKNNHEVLQKIDIYGNIFADHFSKNVFNALLETKAVLSAAESPEWVPYDRMDKCKCCMNKFTWHSTFQGVPQELRDRHNCRACGGLVCGPCSTRRATIPKLGVLFPTRVCDTCFYKGQCAM